MFRRAATRAAQHARVASTVMPAARGMATSSYQASGKKAPAVVALAAAFAGGVAMTSVVQAKEQEPDLDKIREEIVELFEKDNYIGPTFVRLAWHSSGSYKKADNSGGSSGATIRFAPEINHGGNAGLIKAVERLEPVKQRHPEISYADLYVLAGVTMIEEMGGPKVPFRLGRPDEDNGDNATPDDRLPDADKGSEEKTTSHVRDVFYRMGFNDRELVALLGAHAIGRCYPDRSGYDGPWTNSEWTFSNEFYRELLENEWTYRKWDGPQQYADKSGQLMMLPADMVLMKDPKFRKFVEMYAKDEDLWFDDFTKAFQKLTELGVKFPSQGWSSYFWG